MKIRPELQNISTGYAMEATRRVANEPGSDQLTYTQWNARWEEVCMELIGKAPTNPTHS
jgi:hypothetical protein